MLLIFVSELVFKLSSVFKKVSKSLFIILPLGPEPIILLISMLFKEAILLARGDIADL